MEGDFISVQTRHCKPSGQGMKREKWNCRGTRKSGETHKERKTRQVRSPQAWDERASLAKGRNQQVCEPCRHSHICHLQIVSQ